jgi:hypothetical protein
MKFNKKQLETLKQAIQNLKVGSGQIADVKCEFQDNKHRNDEFYGLEDIETRIDEAISDLESFL